MVVSIHQPDYISYLGYFYKISKSDVFVYLDDAQFSNDNMHHWNRIKTPQGECRLKIPVQQHMGDAINRVRTKDELKWKDKHLKTIEMNYKKATFFDDIFPQFQQILMQNYNSLADMNIAINNWIIDGFGFKVKIVKSSELNLNSVKEERVIDIVKLMGGNVYISGHGAKAYQVEKHFTDREIELVYTEYQPIEYKQCWPKVGFLPYMSVIDYLFNYGFDWEYVKQAVEGLKNGDR
ncbi:MAG: WbqC family protein [Ruminococcus sp.]|nr:WbqC family protein [Ruminococcus sp.]